MLTNWTELSLYESDGSEITPTSDKGLRNLREYRETGGMNLYLVNPGGEEFDAETERDANGRMACDMGPAPDEIDWSGFPDA